MTTGQLALRPARTRACGHDRHVGTCGACQRAQLARWQAQLSQASEAGAYRGRLRGRLVSEAFPGISDLEWNPADRVAMNPRTSRMTA